MKKAQIEALKRQDPGSPMNDEQISLLRDIQAFLDFCILNGLSFRSAMGALAHDVNGILAPDDYFGKGIFTPKVKGYALAWPETLSEMATMATDPAMKQEHAEIEEQETSAQE
jgi:hypothetical protein